MADTTEQIENRIALWRETILDYAAGDGLVGSMTTLLDSFEADVREHQTRILSPAETTRGER